MRFLARRREVPVESDVVDKGAGRCDELTLTTYNIWNDPKYAEDPETKGKGEVTLSYTFFPSVEGAAPGEPKAVPAARSDAKSKETAPSKAVAAAPPLGGSVGARL